MTRKYFNPLSVTFGTLALLSLTACFLNTAVICGVAAAIFAGMALFTAKYSLIKVSYVQHKASGVGQDDLFTNKQYNFGSNWDSITYLYHLNSFCFTPLAVTDGVQRYIRRLGFYEGGGSENAFRLDPEKVVRFITG